MTNKIIKGLVGSNDPNVISRMKKAASRKNNCQIDYITDGTGALQLAQEKNYDIIVLDTNLLKMDGLDVCRNLRLNNIQSPIIIITDRQNISEKVATMCCGANDYLPRDFSYGEISIRCQALLEKKEGKKDPVIKRGLFSLNPLNQELDFQGEKIKLSQKEFEIMCLLLQNANSIVKRQDLVQLIWGESEENMLSNTVEVHISRLRHRIGLQKCIRTFTNLGYMLNVDESETAHVE